MRVYRSAAVMIAVVSLNAVPSAHGQMAPLLRQQYRQVCGDNDPRFAAMCAGIRRQIEEVERDEGANSPPPEQSYSPPAPGPAYAARPLQPTSPVRSAQPYAPELPAASAAQTVTFGELGSNSNQAQRDHWAKYCGNRTMPSNSPEAQGCKATLDYVLTHPQTWDHRSTPTANQGPTASNGISAGGAIRSSVSQGGYGEPVTAGGNNCISISQTRSEVQFTNSSGRQFHKYYFGFTNKCTAAVSFDWWRNDKFLTRGANGGMTLAPGQQKELSCEEQDACKGFEIGNERAQR